MICFIPASSERSCPRMIIARGIPICAASRMELMVEFEWPLNLVQLEKVLRQMIAASSGFYITTRPEWLSTTKSRLRSPPKPSGLGGMSTVLAHALLAGLKRPSQSFCCTVLANT